MEAIPEMVKELSDVVMYSICITYSVLRFSYNQALGQFQKELEFINSIPSNSVIGAGIERL